MAAPRYVTTQGQLGDALGISPSGVKYYLRRGAPGKTAQGYDVEAIREWRDSNVEAPRGGGKAAPGGEDGGGDRERLLKAQADERRAKADLAALKLAIERGDYLAKSEVEEWDRARISIVKRGLLGLGRQVAPLVIGLSIGEAEVVINRATRDLLNRFAAVK